MFCHSPIKSSSVEQVILIIRKDLQLLHKTLPPSIEQHNIWRNIEVYGNVYDELGVGAVRSATKILAQPVNIKGPGSLPLAREQPQASSEFLLYKTTNSASQASYLQQHSFVFMYSPMTS